jgi:hypothetical protein
LATWTDPSVIATLALGAATVVLAIVVIVDGRLHRRHDAHERRVQRRHDHLRAAHAALLRSQGRAIEMDRNRGLLVAIVNAMPPALSTPLGRDDWTLQAEFLDSVTEAMSWLRTIRHEVDSGRLKRFGEAAESLLRGGGWGRGRLRRLDAYIKALGPVAQAIQEQLLDLDLPVADHRGRDSKWLDLMSPPPRRPPRP